MKPAEIEAQLGKMFSCAWMNGEDNLDLLADLQERRDDRPQHVKVVDVRWAMQGDKDISLGQVLAYGFRLWQQANQSVNHYVADKVDFFLGHTFADKIFIPI